ncbi:MAG: sulfatase-like hydrolase/transferase [Armatimonadota bacterium]|nr:sulfatase-like hydrolase/transferase [Armatimonadota bacterium]
MNFIFFNPDEMRAESLGCYGHPLAPTPNIDALAAQGVRFDQCHVQHTVCTPSRCSFMTGWYPHVRGHRTLWHALRPEEPNLLKYLKGAGYEVVWGGKNDLLSPASFADSVTDYRLGTRSRRAIRRGGPWHHTPPYAADDPRYYSFLYQPLASRIEELGDFAQVDGAIEYLRAKPREPFAIYLPLSFPHCPYWAPGAWHHCVDPDALPPLRPCGLPGKPNFHQLIRRYYRLDQLDDALFRKINAVYLGMIGVVDQLLGELVRALEETGYARNTALFFWSDHGDWAGDYGLVEKWPSGLDDCLTRIPFIACVPGGEAGHVVHEQVEAFDLMATVLDLAEVPARHTHFARSLLPQIGGAPGDPGRAVFAEGGYDPHEPHCFEGRATGDFARISPEAIYYPKGKLQQDHPESVSRAAMVRTPTHKLIYRPTGVCELYDLREDPRELNNLYGRTEYAVTQAGLERQLLDWYVHTADVTPFDEDPRGLPPSQP